MSLQDSITVELLSRMGELGAQVANVSGQNIVILQQLERASDSRGELHKKMEAMADGVTGKIEGVRKDVAALSTRVTIVEKRLDHVQPISERHEVQEQQRLGVRNFFTRGRLVVAGTVGAAASAGGAWHQWPVISKFFAALLRIKT